MYACKRFYNSPKTQHFDVTIWQDINLNINLYRYPHYIKYISLLVTPVEIPAAREYEKRLLYSCHQFAINTYYYNNIHSGVKYNN